MAMTVETIHILAQIEWGGLLSPTFCIPAAIVLIGLLVVGPGDTRRFSLGRVWAIGDVCFYESLRRRVLWIIPLAVFGIIVISQVQRVIDEQDAVRETIKIGLFTTGLVATLASIVLACTNLPREIENKVIITVLTKPTSRLELVVGKILGFARLSALILIIMGLFTYGYLQLRTWQEEQAVTSRLQNDPDLSSAERNTLEYYSKAGLLNSRSYVQPVGVDVLAPVFPSLHPTTQASQAMAAAAIPLQQELRRGSIGDSETEFLFPISADPEKMFPDPSNADRVGPMGGMGSTGAMIALRINWLRYGPPNIDATKKQVGPPPAPEVEIDIQDGKEYSLVGGGAMHDANFPAAKDAHADRLKLPDANEVTDKTGAGGAGSEWLWVYLPPKEAGSLYQQKRFYIRVVGVSHNVEYFADESSCWMAVAPPVKAGEFSPSAQVTAAIPLEQRIEPDTNASGKAMAPMVRGRPSPRAGQELTGKRGGDAYAPLAVFRFRHVQLGGLDASQPVALEIKAPIERGGDVIEETDLPTGITLFVRHPGSATDLSAPIDLKLESKLTGYAGLPPSMLSDGNFDVLMRCDAPGHVISVLPSTLQLVAGHQAFGWNLIKSLFIMWMLTVLVITLAVMASTFVSWPIAVVLTSVLLMGHWCVTQVADTNDSTLGRNFATDLGVTDPSKAEALAGSVNTLTGSLQALGAALPDIDQFGAIDDIAAGLIVSRQNIADALVVLGGFALPGAVLAYVILRFKEVAP